MSEDGLRERLEEARREGLAAIEAASDVATMERVRVTVFGRKAPLSRARSSLRSVSDDLRKELGRLATEVQRELEGAMEARLAEFEGAEREQRWERERLDVSLPGEPHPIGSVHPLTRTMWDLVDIFIGLGYTVAEGPEVEYSTYEFDALNMPPEHPSRSLGDTYYVKDSAESVCLRSQTSPVQIRTMEAQQPPVYVVCPGRTYRRDDVDATHLNQFAQMEGLAVDEGLTMGDLKGTLRVVAQEVFGKDLDVRFRPHFFPFTEPSAEMDVQCFVCGGSGCRLCRGEGWIELLGCGMVHPSLFEWVGYDPERYSGFAFGMGIERTAAFAHRINDLRYFYENDLRFLGQFGGMR